MNNLAEQWIPVCELDELTTEVGVRALVQQHQVAVFRLQGDQVYAVDAIDPFSRAPVLSRGLIGDVGGEEVVTSPIYKQHFRLKDGRCVEDETVSIPVFDVDIVDGTIYIAGMPR